MSTDTQVVRANLRTLDREVKSEERKLGFFRRFSRRYLGLRTAVVAKVASTFGIIKGLCLASAIGGKAFLVALAVKLPVFALVVEWVVAVFEGAIQVGANTS